MFERVRKVILKNHNIAVDNILINVKEYTKSVKEQLITLQNGVENIDTIFDKVTRFSQIQFIKQIINFLIILEIRKKIIFSNFRFFFLLTIVLA